MAVDANSKCVQGGHIEGLAVFSEVHARLVAHWIARILFRGSHNEVSRISEIGKDYLCDESCSGLHFLQSEEWVPSAGPIQVNDIERFRLDQELPNTAWRRLLIGAAEFSTRFPLP